MKFTIIKSCLARFSGIFALGTPSNIHGTAISYRCAKFGAFVNSVAILTLRGLTISGSEKKRIQTCVWSLLFLSIYLYFVYPVMFFFFVEGWGGGGGAFLLIIFILWTQGGANSLRWVLPYLA